MKTPKKPKSGNKRLDIAKEFALELLRLQVCKDTEAMSYAKIVNTAIGITDLLIKGISKPFP